jgi:hypothetical protein
LKTYLADTLVVFPSCEELTHLCASLPALHSIDEHDCSTQEFVLGRSIESHFTQLFLDLFLLVCKLLELTIISFKTLDVLVKALLSLLNSLLLVRHEFLLLIFVSHLSFPMLEHSGDANAVSLLHDTFRELAERSQARFQ